MHLRRQSELPYGGSQRSPLGPIPSPTLTLTDKRRTFTDGFARLYGPRLRPESQHDSFLLLPDQHYCPLCTPDTSPPEPNSNLDLTLTYLTLTLTPTRLRLNLSSRLGLLNGSRRVFPPCFLLASSSPSPIASSKLF